MDKPNCIIVKSEAELKAVVGRDYLDVLKSLKKNGVIVSYSICVQLEVTWGQRLAFQTAMAFDEAKHPNNAPNPRKESHE